MTFKKIVLGFVFLWFFIGSFGHFLFADTEASIVPDYIPFHLALVYISGVCELIGALALIIRRWRAWAGLGLCLLTVAVTPANVDMALHADRFPSIHPVLLELRLVMQVILLVAIWWSSDARIAIGRLTGKASRR